MAADRRRAEVDTDELAATIGLYVLGEISLGRVAERHGIISWELLGILEQHGVQPRLGPYSWPSSKPKSSRRSTSNERVSCPLLRPCRGPWLHRPGSHMPSAAGRQRSRGSIGPSIFIVINGI